MTISNVDALLGATYRNSLSMYNPYGMYGGNVFGTSFYSLLQNQIARQQTSGEFSKDGCYIPSSMLAKMNSSEKLKQQIFDEIEECSKAAAEGSETIGKTVSTQRAQNAYQQYLMRQTAMTPYRMRSSMFSSGYRRFW